MHLASTFAGKYQICISTFITRLSQHSNGAYEINYMQFETMKYEQQMRTGKFFSEAVILRVHIHSIPNFSDYFSKWKGEKTFLFLSFDHFSQRGCAATKEL